LGDGDIRLLDLEPDQSDQPIRCTTSIGRATGCVNQYCALSYTWGSRNDMKTIICNGSVIEVTKNLFDALFSFRRTDMPIQLWVDALCINQQDNDERTRMVKIMTDIYRNASYVAVWVGPSTSSTTLAVELIHSLEAKFSDFKSVALGTTPWSEVEAMGLPHPLDSRWKVLDQFLSHPWFRRVWTIQEVSVTRKAVFCCGPHKVDFETLYMAVVLTEAICFNGQRKQLYRLGYKRVRRLNKYRRAINAPKYHLPLWELLWMERTAQATDDRDKVFALLGLASDVNMEASDAIIPDYTLDTAEVYTKTFQWIARKTDTLDFLAIAGIPPQPTKYLLPSWVPDLSFALMTLPLNLLGIGSAYPKCDNQSKGRSLGYDGIKFIMHGIFIDKVLVSGKVHRGSPENEDAPPEIAIKTWMDMCSDSFGKRGFHEYPASDCHHWKEAFDRTLVGNQWIDGSVLAAEHEDDYHAWIKLMLLYRACYPNGRIPVRLWPPPDVPQPIDTLLLDRFNRMCYGRCLFITEAGYIGVGPESSTKGDSVYIIDRVKVPLILRPKRCFIGDGQHAPFAISNMWQLVGEAYVHGIMNGERYKEDKIEEFQLS
jgi:hypothetical protein